jgi:hypothetical protein
LTLAKLYVLVADYDYISLTFLLGN